MGSMLDIVSATMIGAMLLLTLLVATDTMTTEFFNYNADAITQMNLANISTTMQHDIRKMGYGIPKLQIATVLQKSDPDHLIFLSQLNLDADYYAYLHGNIHMDDIPDTIEYRIIPHETITYWDTALVTYRVMRTLKVSQEATDVSLVGIVANSDVFRYLDQAGNETGVPSAIKMVEVTLTAYDPRVVLSREYVMSQIDTLQGAAYRDRELRRLLRPSYWRQTRLVSKNLRR